MYNQEDIVHIDHLDYYLDNSIFHKQKRLLSKNYIEYIQNIFQFHGHIDLIVDDIMIDMTNIDPNKYQLMDVDGHNLQHIFHMMYPYN